MNHARSAMKMPFMVIKGSVTAARGFRAAGMAAGIKSSGRRTSH